MRVKDVEIIIGDKCFNESHTGFLPLVEKDKSFFLFCHPARRGDLVGLYVGDAEYMRDVANKVTLDFRDRKNFLSCRQRRHLLTMRVKDAEIVIGNKCFNESQTGFLPIVERTIIIMPITKE